jgi:hypothetical protein
MALFQLLQDAKGLRKGTYLTLTRVDGHRQLWELCAVHHDEDPEVQKQRPTRFFQRSELGLLKCAVPDKTDTPIDGELIALLAPAKRKKEKEESDDEEDEDEDDDEDDADDGEASPPEKTVGLFDPKDDDKISYDELIAQLLTLKDGVQALSPERGLPLDEFRKGVEELSKLQRSLVERFNGPSGVRDVAARNPGGIAAIADQYSPWLLEASYVLRAARAWLDAGGKGAPRPPQEVLAICPDRAKIGLVVVRTWKKYLAYRAIWKGTKWSSGKLAATLGGKSKDTPTQLATARRDFRKEVKKAKTSGKFDEIFSAEPGTLEHLKNPIAELSRANVKRLKLQLRQTALELFGVDPREINRELVRLGNSELREELDATRAEWLEAKEAVRWVMSYGNLGPGGEPPPSLVGREEALRKKCQSIEGRLEILETLPDSDLVMNGFGLLPGEPDLCAAIMDLPFTIKHATPNWYCIQNDGSLDSLLEFQKKNPNWSSEFSTPGNVANLGNHGFVFFRVDVGDDPIVTRYGDTLLVDDLSVIERDGWISLFDQLKPLSSTTMVRCYDHLGALIRHAKVDGTNNSEHAYEYGYLPARDETQAESFARTQVDRFKGERWQHLDRTCKFTDFVFYGPQIRIGLALSLILELRYLARSGYRRHVMERFRALEENEADRTQFLSRLISQTFRPEGKYPVALRFTRHTEDFTVRKPEGDKRWLPDGTANPEVMRVIKVIQRRKYLADAVPQAKKTAASHRKYQRDAEKASDPVKAEDQRKKAAAREAEFARLSSEREEVERQYKEAQKTHPELFPDETEQVDARFRRGV